MISCVYVSSRNIGHKSFGWLDYEIIYCESCEDGYVCADKVYLCDGSVGICNNFVDVYFIYGSASCDVGKYVEKFGMLCFVTDGTVIVNKRHYLCSDMMEWLGYFCTRVGERKNFVVYFIRDGLEMFLDSRLHKEIKLVKNAYK